MSLPQVVRRYAQALYEVAEEREALPEVAGDMDAVARVLRELPEVLAWCRAGHSHGATAEAFVGQAFPFVGELTATTLRIAARHDRLAAIPLLPQAFQAVIDQHSLATPVLLEVAQEPDEELLRGVGAGMAKKTGHPVKVSHQLVPELVGGFRLFWNDTMLDRSARARLKNLQVRLKAN